MAGVIVVSDTLATTNADILQGGRLQTVPAGGFLTFELQADANDATNFYTLSIQLPNGDTPLNEVNVPAGDAYGELDERKKMMITLPVQQGGHTVLSATRSGTASLAYRVVYTPA